MGCYFSKQRPRKIQTLDVALEFLMSLHPNPFLWNIVADYALDFGGEKCASLPHYGTVWALVALDNDLLASGCGDDLVRVWDLRTNQLLFILRGHTDWVTSLVKLNDGRIASGSADKTIRVWNLKTRACELKVEYSDVYAMAAVEQGRLAVSSWDNLVTVLDATTGAKVQHLQHPDWVRAIAAADQKHLLTGADDHLVRLWHLPTGQCLHVMRGHGDWITSLCCIGNGLCASGSEDQTVKMWNCETGQLLKTFRGHTGTVNGLVKLDAAHIVSASYDNFVRVWDITDGSSQVLHYHTGPVWCLAACNNKLMSGARDTKVIVYE